MLALPGLSALFKHKASKTMPLLQVTPLLQVEEADDDAHSETHSLHSQGSDVEPIGIGWKDVTDSKSLIARSKSKEKDIARSKSKDIARSKSKEYK